MYKITTIDWNGERSEHLLANATRAGAIITFRNFCRNTTLAAVFLVGPDINGSFHLL
jgi:hypothetical protein